MKRVIAIAFVLVMAGCANQSPDTSVTSTAIKTPSAQPSVPGELVASETAKQLCKEVIGLSEQQAVETIESISSEKLTARITRRDDESYAVTEDYSVSRLNLEIDNGLVTKCTIG